MVKPSILVPLYVYPQNDAWLPLKIFVGKHPSITFNLIINPFNGPHPFDDAYLTGLAALSSYHNIRLIAYIHALTTLGEPISPRPISDIRADMKAWNTNIATAKIQGIDLRFDGMFIDEGSTLESDISFYRSIAELARSEGFKTIILNPGQITHPGYFNFADYVVQIENSHAAYKKLGGVNYLTKNIRPENRAKSAVLLHSFEGGKMRKTKEVGGMVEDLVEKGFGMLFFTEKYEAFGDVWPIFVEALAAC